MARKKLTTDTEAETDTVETPVETPAPKTVTLRLLQNAFVRGELALAGTQFDFPEQEAHSRLKAAQFWVRL